MCSLVYCGLVVGAIFYVYELNDQIQQLQNLIHVNPQVTYIFLSGVALLSHPSQQSKQTFVGEGCIKIHRYATDKPIQHSCPDLFSGNERSLSFTERYLVINQLLVMLILPVGIATHGPIDSDNEVSELLVKINCLNQTLALLYECFISRANVHRQITIVQLL